MQTIYTKSAVVFRGTITGLRISAVDGTAFVDNLPAAVQTLVAANPDKLLFEAYDSSNRVLSGVLKAAGSAETTTNLGITGFTNSVTAGFEYETFTTSGADITSAINSSGYGHAMSNQLAATTGKLIKLSITATINSGANTSFNVGDIVDGRFSSYAGVNPMAAGSNTGYVTNAPGHRYCGAVVYENINYSANGILAETVDTPGTSGCTIVNSKGGTVYNFLTNQWVAASYNAASYYCIVRLLR